MALARDLNGHGPLSQRPPAETTGRLWRDDTVAPMVLYYDQGTAWEQVTLVPNYLPYITGHGSLGNRTAAGTAGRFWVDDTLTPMVVYFDTGAAWEQVAPTPMQAGITVPPGSLASWQAAKALAGAGTGKARVCVIGDSITQGLQATSWPATSWLGKLKAQLQAVYNNGGAYFGIADSGPFCFAAPAADKIWSFSGTAWNAYNMIGPMGYVNGVAGDKAIFAALEAYIDFDLHVSQTSSGTTLSVTVDGVLQPGTPTCNNATWTRHAVYQYSGFGRTTHTVQVALTGSGYAYVSGITYYPNGRSAAGVTMIKLARTGYTSALLTPPYPTTQPAYLPAAATVEDFSPHLVILALGVNDCNSYMGLDLYKWNLLQAAQSAQNAGASLIVLANFNGSGNANGRSYGLYIGAAREVAAAYNGVFINAHDIFGTGSGLLNADNIHPNDAGHALLYSTILSVL